MEHPDSTIVNASRKTPQEDSGPALVRHPGSRRWRVDRFHSYMMGQTFTGAELPLKVHALAASIEWQIWTELVAVSICHQANWDKLHSRVVEVARAAPGRLHPSSISEITASSFRSLFGQAYDSERLRSTERAKILRSLGRSVGAKVDTPIFPWLTLRPVHLGGTKGLYFWLSSIDAFSEDPLNKKSRIFVHDLLQYGLIEVADPQNIAPAVDYHLIRLYLRTGRVLPVRVELFDRLIEDGTPRVEFHTDLRAAVEEAMMYTAFGSGLRIDQLNHIEWQVARSFCLRKDPRCDGCALPEKPVDAVVDSLASKVGGCPLNRTCRGASDVQLRSIVDPRSASSYY